MIDEFIITLDEMDLVDHVSMMYAFNVGHYVFWEKVTMILKEIFLVKKPRPSKSD